MCDFFISDVSCYVLLLTDLLIHKETQFQFYWWWGNTEEGGSMHWWELKMRAEIAANMYVRACLIRPTGLHNWTGTSSLATSTIVAHQVRLLHHYNEAMYFFFTDSSWFKMIFCDRPLKLKTKLSNFNFASFRLAKPSWIHCPGTDIYMKTNSFLWHFDKVGRLIFYSYYYYS